MAKFNEIPLSKTFSSVENNKASFQEITGNEINDYRRTSYETQTIDGEFFSSMEIYKINLWKLGMMLYELAYHKLPFPIEFVAYKTQHN